ncbi:hypothetical protein V6N00_12690 [Tersicoccus sp. MR15.9]|uniref:hypothetical protein n=1 Tax=Tersicoccus mangrovi TaxID=3121635 RepID=UPI002FE5AC73
MNRNRPSITPRRAAAAVLAGAVALSLTACGGFDGDATVTGKAYNAPYPLTQMICNGKGSCTPVITWMPETWTLHTSKGNLDVIHLCYDAVKVGQTVTQAYLHHTCGR